LGVQLEGGHLGLFLRHPGLAHLPLRLEELLSADEAFLTGTTREVVPVTQVDETTLGNGRPGPLTRRVMEAFGAYAPAPCGQGAFTAAASPSGRTTG
jgi:hypothetical protein